MLQELNHTQEPAATVLPENDVRTPRDVLNHPTMSTEAKRAMLASWASDRHAVPNFPGVRQLDDGSLVSLADILQALRMLDEPDERSPGSAWGNLVPLADVRGRRRGEAAKYWLPIRRPHDDDLPPRPAAALFPPTYIRTNSVAMHAAAERARRRIALNQEGRRIRYRHV